MIGRFLVCGLFLISYFAAPASAAAGAAKSFALIGVPLIQLRGTMEEAVRIELDGAQSNSHRVVILKKGDDYFWDTRDAKKLVHLVQGNFDLFVDPTGGGYVKVIPSEGKRIYIEHFSEGLNTFTYWGVAERFEP